MQEQFHKVYVLLDMFYNLREGLIKESPLNDIIFDGVEAIILKNRNRGSIIVRKQIKVNSPCAVLLWFSYGLKCKTSLLFCWNLETNSWCNLYICVHSDYMQIWIVLTSTMHMGKVWTAAVTLGGCTNMDPTWGFFWDMHDHTFFLLLKWCESCNE